MIKNQKQASIARNRLVELNKSLNELNANQSTLSSAEYKLGVNSIQYLIDDLIKDIKEYEYLINGNFHILKPVQLSDINKLLISARIAKKTSQKDLADLLGIQEQQIQRYEANDYESATWTRIQEVASALGIKFIFKDVVIPGNKPNFQIPRNSTRQGINNAKIKLKSKGCLNYAA